MNLGVYTRAVVLLGDALDQFQPQPGLVLSEPQRRNNVFSRLVRCSVTGVLLPAASDKSVARFVAKDYEYYVTSVVVFVSRTSNIRDG